MRRKIEISRQEICSEPGTSIRSRLRQKVARLTFATLGRARLPIWSNFQSTP